MKKNYTLAAFCFGLFFANSTNAQTPRFQVIHNSADETLNKVDVYAGSQKVIDDVAFRTASPFENGYAGMPITIGVAPSNSSSSADAFYTKKITLESGKTYIIVADGINSDTAYTSAKPFDLHIYETGREKANTASNTDILVHHGVTDAPSIDVNNAANNSVLVNDLEYSKFSNYLELPTADYTINVSNADGSSVIKEYKAPLSTLSLQGKAITVVASGFLDPSKNNNGSEFGLWVALPSGGNLVKLEENLSVNTFDFNTSSIFPNPASNNFTINLEKFKNTKANLIDIYGRVVKQISLTQANTIVNVSDLKTGMYFVQLQNNNNVSKTLKIQVK